MDRQRRKKDTSLWLINSLAIFLSMFCNNVDEMWVSAPSYECAVQSNKSLYKIFDGSWFWPTTSLSMFLKQIPPNRVDLIVIKREYTLGFTLFYTSELNLLSNSGLLQKGKSTRQPVAFFFWQTRNVRIQFFMDLKVLQKIKYLS